jgi:hypothetical protein
MLKTTEIYQEHIFWVFVVLCYFLFFSQKYFKNRVKNWIATDAPSIQYLLLIIFWSHKKRRKYKKRQKKLYSEENKKNSSSEKRMPKRPENCQQLVEKVQK